MNRRKRTVFWCVAILALVSLSTVTRAQTNPFTKAQVGDRIRKVEDGVDQFEKYLKKPRTRRQEPLRLGTIQRSDNTPPAFGLGELRRSHKPSQTNKG